MSELISVIVPVFNAEKYIQRCVASIINQSYKDIEVVLVDDGSDDSSLCICKKLSDENHNVVVYHKENEGAFSARKYGTFVAKGKYIAFVDADDYVENDFIQNLVSNIADCDICKSACNWIDIDGSQHVEEDNFDIGMYAKSKDISYLYSHMIFNYGRPDDYYRGILTYMVCNLYKKDLALKVFDSLDPKLQFCEDAQFVFAYMLYCKKISITKKALYNYCLREDSVTHRKINHYLESLERLYNGLLRVFKNHPLEPELTIQLEAYVAYRLKMAPYYMQFKSNANPPTYEFPFWGKFQGKRVVLYGAGKVGIDYYREIIQRNEFILVAWVDKNYKDIRFPSVPEILDPSVLLNLEYDVLIIATDERKHKEIKEELIGKGIDANVVFWERPKLLVHYN